MPITAIWGNINIPSIEKRNDFGIELKTIEEKESERATVMAPESSKSKIVVKAVKKKKKTVEVAKTAQIGNVKGVEQWRPLCIKYFGSKANECLAIMKAESGGNTRAYSSTSDAGLMQIHIPIWGKFFGMSKEQFFNPEINMKCAKVIYDRSGSWKPWSTSRKLGL
jgi:hypothetical protein